MRHSMMYDARMWKTLLTRGAVFSILISASAASAAESIPNPISSTSFPCLVKALSEAAITIAVPVAVVAIIFAGLKFIIAGAQGNDAQIAAARKMLFWIVIGTAVVVGSFVIASAAINLFGGTAGALAC